MNASIVSPELALIDPELRMQAVADLPELAPFDFLRLRDHPQRLADFDEFSDLAADGEVDSRGSELPLPLTVAAYFAVALTRVCVVDGFLLLAVAAAVVLMNAL